MRLALQVEQSVAKTEGTQEKTNKEPKALACYGLDVQVRGEDGSVERKVWLRFVDGRPVSEVTCRYLEWRRRAAPSTWQEGAAASMG